MISIPRPEIGFERPRIGAVGRATPRRFRPFIRRVNPKYVFYDHCNVLVDLLQQVADGHIERLMVFEPPRHGKSELVSRIFPAYLLRRKPAQFVGLCSYAAELAYTFSRNARDNYRTSGGQVKGDAAAVKQWETGKGGGLWAAGVGGPITGKGFHYGIIDDPLKNAEDAGSDSIREKQWDWYQSTFLTREEPVAAQVITLTRWHDDDIAGRIIQQAKETGEVWHVCVMEAVKTDVLPEFPEQFVVHTDKRKTGAALCPERYDADKLAAIKDRIGTYWWSALYQQRPTPLEGGLWKREWMKEVPEIPVGLRNVGYDWDLAYTEKDSNSASAFVKTGRDADGNIYVLDIGFEWFEFPALIGWMKAQDGPHYIEAKASGKSAQQTLSASGVSAVEVPVVGGDKVARTTLATPRAEAGKVRVLQHLIPRLLDDERQGILRFPNGSHDDLNDALVQAIQRHTSAKLSQALLLPI